LLKGYKWQLGEAAFRSLPDNCWVDLLPISDEKQHMRVIRARAAIPLMLYSNEVEKQMIPLLEAVDPRTRVKAAQCLQTVMTESRVEVLREYRGRLQDVSGDNNWEYRARG
jgi:hypothetical protein